MTFWKSFFDNKNQNNQQKKINQIKTEEILLINNFQNEDHILNLYFSTNNDINLYDLEKLCDSVGWFRRPLKKVKIALDNSFLIGYIFYYNKKRKILIGFARATSDTSFNATIWDVVIHPQFQKKGLGKILMNQLIKNLRCHDISTITLFADPHVIKFYHNLGFITDPDGVKGMFWYPL